MLLEYPKSRRPRKRRHKQKQRMATALLEVMKGDPRLVVLGPDPLFDFILADAGGEPPTQTACQILVDSKPATIVCVPDRIWSREPPMEKLRYAKMRMREYGRSCILVPQSLVDAHSDTAVFFGRWTDILDKILVNGLEGAASERPTRTSFSPSAPTVASHI